MVPHGVLRGFQQLPQVYLTFPFLGRCTNLNCWPLHDPLNATRLPSQWLTSLSPLSLLHRLLLRLRPCDFTGESFLPSAESKFLPLLLPTCSRKSLLPENMARMASLSMFCFRKENVKIERENGGKWAHICEKRLQERMASGGHNKEP
ncbi:hypothetical protein CK203_007721 [Vitis vinifera]|uniref:Uncharacterized protein n=1 Tax=Vitis vinifera TaxID=29760 RepID=A0A438K162_VITVI|nr:hypothetical protein CK203_007721 [Vitis vinifera]